MQTRTQAEIQMASMLDRWLGKFQLASRWPCMECGRPNPQHPLRLKEVRVMDPDNKSRVLHAVTEGCTLCNTYSLCDDTRKLLWLLEMLGAN